MAKRYYSSRNKKSILDAVDLYSRTRALFELLQTQDYLLGSLGIYEGGIPEQAILKVKVALGFSPFPFKEWSSGSYSTDRLFDTIEFLFNHVSKPGKWVGTDYDGYREYDIDAAQKELLEMVNAFLCDFEDGYELNAEGHILSSGGGLNTILNAEIIEFDEENVDSKIRNSIKKWRNRELSLDVRREAIREMADVFEWLQKNHDLSSVMDKKDEHDLFNIANNFAIRHHNPKQKSNYDMTVWYPWIFHFYLATYHATVRLLKKKDIS